MATAKKTSFSDDFSTLKGLEKAIATVRQDGAQDDATVTMFALGTSYNLKAEWHEEVADPAAPPADTREQPVQATPDVQPDGLVNETPKAGA